MQTHLLIKIAEHKTTVDYIESGDKVHTHDYLYGYSQGEDKHSFLAGILFMLETINSVDHIPNKFIIETDTSIESDNIMRHKVQWYADLLRNYNYTQFIKATKEPACVIINNNERYKKRNRLHLKV